MLVFNSTQSTQEWNNLRKISVNIQQTTGLVSWSRSTCGFFKMQIIRFIGVEPQKNYSDLLNKYWN